MDVRLLTDPSVFDGVGPGSRVAVDTEFHGERTYRPILHLVQVRVDDGPAWILDAHDPELLARVGPSLRRGRWLVHSGGWDLPLLCGAFGGVAEIVDDTQIAAGLVASGYPAGLARLCGAYLGVELAKDETLSDWSVRPLSAAQVRYAGADVWELGALWDRLSALAAELGREGILRAACDEAARMALDGPAPEDAWMSVPGHASLSPAAAAVLQELAAWRERHAAATDQPAHAVLAPRILIDLAKRSPATEAALLAGRGAPRSFLKKHAAELLDAIRTGAERPASARPPTIAAGSLEAARAAWIRAWAERAGLAEGWSARLVVPDAVIPRVASGTPPRDALTGWRAELLGPDRLARLLDERIPWPE